MIRVDRVRRVIKGSIASHALLISDQLAEPETVPLEVYELKDEIKQLKKIRGTEELINVKLQQIRKLSSKKSTARERLLVAALMDLRFWEQPEEQLNARLREIIESIEVKLGSNVQSSRVCTVRMRTPSAPLARVWDGNQDEPLVAVPGEIHWRVNIDGTKDPVAIYRLSDLIRDNIKREQIVERIEQLLALAQRGSAGQHDLEEIGRLCEEFKRIGTPTDDPTIEVEERLLHFSAEDMPAKRNSKRSGQAKASQ
jgi:hypothetical protein